MFWFSTGAPLSKASVHSHYKHKGGKSKRMRTSFTNEQLSRLEKEFARQQYMVGSERFLLASALQLTEAQVNSYPKFNIQSSAHKVLILHRNINILKRSFFPRLKFGFRTGASSGESRVSSNSRPNLPNWDSRFHPKAPDLKAERTTETRTSMISQRTLMLTSMTLCTLEKRLSDFSSQHCFLYIFGIFVMLLIM